MNKLTTAGLIALLVATPKTPVVQATTVAETARPVVHALSLEEVVNQQVSTATLSEVKAEPAPQAAPASTPPLPTPSPTSYKAIAKQLVDERFGPGQFAYFDTIVQRESSWNPNAVNRQSGACGFGQALPCRKMSDRSPVGQLEWMTSYIAERYGTPARAKAFWDAHHWY